MKRFLPALCFLFTFNSHSQELLNLKNATTVTTIGYWNKGENKTYHVSNNETRYENNTAKPTRESKTEYDITLKVTDSSENSYTLQMVYHNFVLPLDISERDKELLKIAENMKIVYKTNELGGFDHIVNKKELQTSMQKVWDAVMKKLMGKVTDQKQKAEIEAGLSGIKNMLSDENNIDAFFSNDILMIHGMYGVETSLNKAEKIELQFPAIGNIVLAGTGTITLKEINKPRNECKIDIVEQPNKDDLNKYMKNIFDYIFGSMTEGKTDLSQFKFSSETREHYTMELSSGWFKKINSSSTVNMSYKNKALKKITRSEYVLK